VIGILEQQRHRPGQQRADGLEVACVELAQRAQGRRQGEEHHRRGTVGAPALQPVHALDRGLGLWVAADAVHGVGRKHGHPAARDTALEPAHAVA
jgi:hypothetical protein